MSVLGKWKVKEVFKDFDSNLKPIYTSVEEALTLDNYKDKQSIEFINSVYNFTEKGIEIIYNGNVINNIKAEVIDGSYYVTDNGLENKYELKPDENGVINFIMILRLERA